MLWRRKRQIRLRSHLLVENPIHTLPYLLLLQLLLLSLFRLSVEIRGLDRNLFKAQFLPKTSNVKVETVLPSTAKRFSAGSRLQRALRHCRIWPSNSVYSDSKGCGYCMFTDRRLLWARSVKSVRLLDSLGEAGDLSTNC